MESHFAGRMRLVPSVARKRKALCQVCVEYGRPIKKDNFGKRHLSWWWPPPMCMLINQIINKKIKIILSWPPNVEILHVLFEIQQRTIFYIFFNRLHIYINFIEGKFSKLRENLQ